MGVSCAAALRLQSCLQWVLGAKQHACCAGLQRLEHDARIRRTGSHTHQSARAGLEGSNQVLCWDDLRGGQGACDGYCLVLLPVRDEVQAAAPADAKCAPPATPFFTKLALRPLAHVLTFQSVASMTKYPGCRAAASAAWRSCLLDTTCSLPT